MSFPCHLFFLLGVLIKVLFVLCWLFKLKSTHAPYTLDSEKGLGACSLEYLFQSAGFEQKKEASAKDFFASFVCCPRKSQQHTIKLTHFTFVLQRTYLCQKKKAQACKSLLELFFSALICLAELLPFSPKEEKST
jgi:hypothetical protein